MALHITSPFVVTQSENISGRYSKQHPTLKG